MARDDNPSVAHNTAHSKILDGRFLKQESANADTSISSGALSFTDKLNALSSPVEEVGKIVRAYGTTVFVSGLNASVGQRCVISSRDTKTNIYADVVGIDNNQVILYLFGSLEGISNRSEVRIVQHGKKIPFSESLAGCILDGAGKIIYQPHELQGVINVSIDRDAPNPLTRKPVAEFFQTGVKIIDSLLSVGRGQRMGIFAAAGVGKSTLLSMLAKHSSADVIVIGLIGERGREVKEFIEQNLGPDGLAKSVLVVSTSDRPALERVSAAKTATTIAEGYRARGKNVLLLIDSVTRYARALREIGLSIGEPPSRRGYPPSVFAELPKLLERAGNNDTGTITAFYTVLEEDEETSDPVSEEVKSILDGHIELSRALAEKGQYPPVDPLTSASRIFHSLVSPQQIDAASQFRQQLAKFQEIELLIAMGEYQEGSDQIADRAIRNRPLIDAFLKQSPNDHFALEDSLNLLQQAIQE